MPCQQHGSGHKALQNSHNMLLPARTVCCSYAHATRKQASRQCKANSSQKRRRKSMPARHQLRRINREARNWTAAPAVTGSRTPTGRPLIAIHTLCSSSRVPQAHRAPPVECHQHTLALAAALRHIHCWRPSCCPLPHNTFSTLWALPAKTSQHQMVRV